MENVAPAGQASAEPQPEPAAAEAEAPRRRLLRRLWDLLRRLPGRTWEVLRRLPMPLVATLLGVLLSAWLFPAFTHEWNDRQKARDVKASIVTDLVAATTNVLNEALIASDKRIWKSSRDHRTPDKWT